MTNSYANSAAGYQPDRELDSLYSAITNRRTFSYDPGSDPLYRSYARQYTQNGRMAMRDTMGQAAALTGGYGSSYSQSLGQQQYNEYMRSLSDVMPELYSMAYQQYKDQGAAMQNAYNMAYQREETEYQRQRDAAADKAAAEKAARERAEAMEISKKLREMTLVVTAKGGGAGRLFGSVTNQEIADALKAKTGIALDKRKIVIADPIKSVGTYTVTCKLGYEINAPLSVRIEEI